jgi:hypothetical protein
MPYFTELWHDKLMEKEDNNGEIPSFFYITKRFRDSIKMSQNTKTKLRIANAIIEQSNQSNQSYQSDKTTLNRQHPRCPCEDKPNNGYHEFKDCPYINKEKQPTGWQPDIEAMKCFKNRCNRSSKYKKALEMAKNKYLNQNTTNEHASSLQVAMMTKQRTSTIPNYIWAFDTASDTHICNDLSKFDKFEPYESMVHIGDITTKIKGFGRVYMLLTNSGKLKTIFKLNNTAYIPEFYINLISASKAKAAGIYYNA